MIEDEVDVRIDGRVILMTSFDFNSIYTNVLIESFWSACTLYSHTFSLGEDGIKLVSDKIGATIRTKT